MKNVQLFIHRHYETIKLVLILLTVMLGLIILSSAQAESNRNSRERADAVLEITRSIKRETEKQTEIINRQFQALCLVLMQVSGEDALKRLDPPIEQRCRELAKPQRAKPAPPVAVEPQPSNGISTAPQAKPEKQSSPRQTPLPGKPNYQQPDPNSNGLGRTLQGIAQPIFDLLNQFTRR